MSHALVAEGARIYVRLPSAGPPGGPGTGREGRTLTNPSTDVEHRLAVADEAADQPA